MGKTTSHPETKMQSFTIFKNKFTTIQSLKDFAALHCINPVGNRSLKVTWINAVVGHYLEAQTIVVAVVIKADSIASTIATKTEEVAVIAVTAAVEVLTSESAVLAYRVVLKSIAFGLVMAWLLSVSAGKWCWAHRSSTAIYHWMKDALSSEVTQYALTYLILGQWVLNEWVDTTRSAVRSTATTCRSWADGIVGDVRSVVG